MKGLSVKRMVVAMALAVATAISGMAAQVHAFSFADGDLVLAIYGNNTEALYNVGPASTRLAPGASFNSLNVSAGLAAASVGANPVKYSLFGFDGTNLSVFAGTTFAPSAINPSQLILVQELNAAGVMQGLIQSIGGLPGDTVAKADPNSFSSQMDQAGSGNYNGAWPVAMQGAIGDVLNIMSGDVGTGTFTQVGRMLLTADGNFVIGNPGPGGSPVPLPAGVVLFGTGVIGLIGIARRSLGKMAA